MNALAIISTTGEINSHLTRQDIATEAMTAPPRDVKALANGSSASVMCGAKDFVQRKATAYCGVKPGS
ncbi:MAG TPA: hypothetical protein VMU16_02850 [Candidatus Binataceae bacterium]|nr:hypothetical protein [Candidatus Binataceae bacterium]